MLLSIKVKWKEINFCLFLTMYVVRDTLFVSPHLQGEGYPGQVQPAGGYPTPPGWGYSLPGGTPYRGREVPHLGYPHQTWLRVPPAGGYLTLGTPLPDLAGVYPLLGRIPHLGYTLVRPGWGATPCQGQYPTSGAPWLDLAGGTDRGYPTLGIPLSDLAGGYPDGGVPTPGTLPPSDLAGGYPLPGGDPTSGTPLSDLARGWGVPWWGTPPRVPPQSDLDGRYWRGTPPWVVLDTLQLICLLRSHRRTFLFVNVFVIYVYAFDWKAFLFLMKFRSENGKLYKVNRHVSVGNIKMTSNGLDNPFYVWYFPREWGIFVSVNVWGISLAFTCAIK